MPTDPAARPRLLPAESLTGRAGVPAHTSPPAWGLRGVQTHSTGKGRREKGAPVPSEGHSSPSTTRHENARGTAGHRTMTLSRPRSGNKATGGPGGPGGPASVTCVGHRGLGEHRPAEGAGRGPSQDKSPSRHMTSKNTKTDYIWEKEECILFALYTFVKFINDLTVFKLLQEKHLQERNKPGGNVGRRQVVLEGEVPTLAGSSTPGGTSSFNGLATWPLASLTVLEGAGDHPPEGTQGKTTPPPCLRGSAHFLVLNTLSPPLSPSRLHTALCLNASQQNHRLTETLPVGMASSISLNKIYNCNLVNRTEADATFAGESAPLTPFRPLPRDKAQADRAVHVLKSLDKMFPIQEGCSNAKDFLRVLCCQRI